jgi:decaprenyl-phosphate phosphoribosyltransferase
MEQLLHESNHALRSAGSDATSVPLARPAPAGFFAEVLPDLQIARPDHWFKNVFMLAGVLLAYLYVPANLNVFSFKRLLLGVISVCLVASSNYVINEILDAPTDLDHPIKRHRPIPSGRVLLPIAYAEWIVLGALGLICAAQINASYFIASVSLLVMGLIYNVPPIRSKELPYIDVLSESINNPIRLALGWFVVIPTLIPPMSLIVSYWMAGAFFMASKRFAEYRTLGNKEVAGAYRKSFRHYDDERLLVSMFVYASGAALLLGVFIIRYHLELILSVPLIAGFFGYYMRVALKPNSAAQDPERLYRETGLMAYLTVCLLTFVALMLVEIPVLYDLFNVAPSQLPALWRF